MIKANFSAYSTYVTDSLNQWDINQSLSVSGLNLTKAPEIHFSNANVDRAIVRQSTMTDQVVTVSIPNSLLQDPLTIKAHIGIYEGNTFKVVELVEIPVKPRKRPADYQLEDTDGEVYSFKALENALANKATNARVDNIVANANKTEGNSELIDGRLGEDGVVYSTLGQAIRTQFGYGLLWRTAPAFDADRCTKIGFYFAGGSENWANIPGAAGMLVTFYGNTVHRLYQMFFEYNTNDHLYIRHQHGDGGFTAWTRLATESEVADVKAEYSIEKQSATLVYIYKRGTKGFIRYHLERTTKPDINLDTWRLSYIYLCDDTKTGVKAISTFGIDQEGVVLLENGADHIGGAHGDENLIDYKLFIDGKGYTLDEDFPAYANDIRLVVHSSLSHVNTTDRCMVRIKQLTFDKDGVHIRNEWEALEELAIKSIRACMFSVAKECVTHYYDSHVNLYPAAVPSSTAGAELSKNGDMVDAYYIGDIIAHHWAGERGGDTAGYSTLLQDYGDRLKSYFNCYENHRAVAGEKMIAENHFSIGC